MIVKTNTKRAGKNKHVGKAQPKPKEEFLNEDTITLAMMIGVDGRKE